MHVAIRQTNTEAFDGRKMERMLYLYMIMHMGVCVWESIKIIGLLCPSLK